MPEPQSGRIVVAGASAGGVEALRALVAGLPADLPAPVVVVIHLPPDARSMLPAILDRAGPLPATFAADRDALQPGRLLVAPPDRQVVVLDGHVRVVDGPRENLHRPAIDPLFRSAAHAYGPGVVAAVLSGSLDDGTEGLGVVRRLGGRTLVQDPTEAIFGDMPTNAIEAGVVEEIVATDQLGPRIAALVAEPRHVPATVQGESAGSNGGDGSEGEGEAERAVLTWDRWDPGRAGMQLSPFVCPDCHGTLWEADEDGVLHFRCRIGHAFSSRSLDAAQAARLEQALAVALRALDERVGLERRLERRARGTERHRAAEHHGRRAHEAEAQMASVKDLLRGIAAGDEATG
ncbi:MAG TPA: chemotaxis protein CheB [Candidatus Limnocylindrales bacterium]|jgi:two-component system chemotaxis response regulator CheB|nr:chemotaxis protein CheB [Candidatus Limnocylindrales bacterium]